VTYVNAMEADDGRRVRYRARLSRALHLVHSGKDMPVLLKTPTWLQKAHELRLRVSGPAVLSKSLKQRPSETETGDLLAAEIEFDVAPSGEREIFVDFFADDRWVDRHAVTLAD
jgi:hypothetical protein